MTHKRIGEHVFKQKTWTEDQLNAVRSLHPEFEPFDLTMMCGTDCMEFIFDTFNIDVFEWCDQQLVAQRPGFVRILETLQYVPEGATPRTRRDIMLNWTQDRDYCDSPEFLDLMFKMLNSVTGANWHKRYAELLAPEAVTDTKKKSKTTSKASPST